MLKVGNLLLVEIPAYGTALPFRVEQIINAPYDRLEYAPLPLTTSTPLSYIETPSSSAPSAVPETGVLPPLAYNSSPVMFPLQNSYDPSDMFYFQKPKNKLLLYKLYARPRWLRVLVEIPAGTFISKFQNTYFSNGGSLSVAVGNFSGLASTGFFRGYAELVQVPGIHYGFIFVNDSSLTVYTSARIEYQDLRVSVPSANDAYLALNGELYRNVVSIVLPIPEEQTIFTNALRSYYGTPGIPLGSKKEVVEDIIAKMKEAMGE